MKPIKFLEQFQVDLFPDRSTVGQELVAHLLTGPSMISSPSTKASEVRAQQPTLPMPHVRRSWRRR